MIMSGQERPFRLSIAELKSWLGIPAEKYRKDGKDRIDHLEERVLRPVKKLLDSTCPYTFTYKKIRENPANSKSTVIGFELMPMQNALPNPLLNSSHSRLLSRIALLYLKTQL